MEFLIKKSRFSEKSRFKESKCADGGHSLNRDFTVLYTIPHAKEEREERAASVCSLSSSMHLTCSATAGQYLLRVVVVVG